MLDQQTISTLRQIKDLLEQLLNQNGGSPNASELPAESEREQMQYQRRQQALQYMRTHGKEIPAHLDYSRNEIHRAGDLMRKHPDWDFERCVAAIRAGR